MQGPTEKKLRTSSDIISEYIAAICFSECVIFNFCLSVSIKMPDLHSQCNTFRKFIACYITKIEQDK